VAAAFNHHTSAFITSEDMLLFFGSELLIMEQEGNGAFYRDVARVHSTVLVDIMLLQCLFSHSCRDP
jgi:hypothetical protein